MLAGLEPYRPEASFPVYAAAVVATVQGKPHFAAETRLSSIDGREYDVWFTACFPPKMLPRGKLLIGILDISADKRAKTALEMSEERYRSLLQFLRSRCCRSTGVNSRTCSRRFTERGPVTSMRTLESIRVSTNMQPTRFR